MISCFGKHRLYLALAGCGKSSELVRIAIEAIPERKNILYLSFNKSIRFEIIGKHNLSKSIVHTFHSLAFNDLKDSGSFKKIFEGFDPDELREYFEDNGNGDNKLELNKKALSMLIKWWCENSDISSFDNLDYIFVDELQDLNKDMIRMLKILCKKNKGVKIIAAGDPYQTIYTHLNNDKVNKNFKKFKKFFGKTYIIELNKNHRSTPAILNFVNGFYETHYADRRYFDLSEFTKTQFSDDVYIHLIQHKRDVNKEINEIIKLYPEKNITILGRVKNELKGLDVYNNEIQISTIHAYKGQESDIIILINTIFNDKIETLEHKNIWNVGITRAKKKLHIVSSFPSEMALSKFKKGTYTLINKQKPLTVSEIKAIPNNPIHLTIEKVKESIIDSIDLQLKYENATFISFEEQNLEKNSKFKTDTKKTIKNFDFVIHRNNKLLTFDFHDLNPLKNLNMSDMDMIEYIKGIEREYFSHLISEDDLNYQRIKRLDLAMYFEITDSESINNLIRFFMLSKTTDAIKKINDSAFYVNLNTKKGAKHRLIKCYKPSYKKTNKVECDDNIIKIEISRVRKDGKNTKNDLSLTFGELFDLSKKNKLKDLYYQWLEYDYPFIIEKPVKNVKLLRERYQIHSLDDYDRYLTENKLDYRKKYVLFNILLDLISIDDRKLIENFFKKK